MDISLEWFEVLGVKLACVEILNPRGGQFTPVNRTKEWADEWLKISNSASFISNRSCGNALCAPESTEDLIYRIRGGRAPYPYDGGQMVSFHRPTNACSSEGAPNPWVIILVYGYNPSPEREWEADPTKLLLPMIPFKTRKQRKIERRGGAKVNSYWKLPRQIFSRQVWSQLQEINDIETLQAVTDAMYEPRPTTWSVMGTPLIYSKFYTKFYNAGYPSRYGGVLWEAPDGWTILSPKSTTEIIKTGLTIEEADKVIEEHKALIDEWIKHHRQKEN